MLGCGRCRKLPSNVLIFRMPTVRREMAKQGPAGLFAASPGLDSGYIGIGFVEPLPQAAYDPQGRGDLEWAEGPADLGAASPGLDSGYISIRFV
ncbi:hypothetical protein AO265_32090 [Pseudomonas sp. ABAC61]|nr:hypothetical protein AO265_32090 [Pseudomonas sp. ABAC61]